MTVSSKLAENEKPVNPWLIAFIASLATFMEVLDTTIVNVALNHIAGSLSATQIESTWILTSYLLTNAIILPISGWIASVFGRKQYFMFSVAAFTVSSFFCGAAESLVALVIFRAIQGLTGGGLQPLQQAIILDTFPVHMRGTAFATTAITIIIAPALGPTLGGLITDNFSWRWIFYINIPFGLVTLWLAKKYLRNPAHAEPQGMKGKKLDFIGLTLIAICLSTLQLILDKGETENWFESDFIIILTILCVSTFVFGIYWLLKQTDPFIEVKLLKIPSFTAACLIVFVIGFVLYSSNLLLPFLLQSHFGYDATLSGLILSPGAMVILLITPIMGKFLINKIYAKYLIAIGFLFTSYGMYYTAHFSPETNFEAFVFFRIMQCIGLPFLFIPASAIAYMDIQQNMNNKASAIYALFRNIGGSLGVSISAAIINHNSQKYQNYLAADLSNGDTEYINYLNDLIYKFQALGLSKMEATNKAMGYTYQELIKQSSLLAYVESFYIMSAISLVLIPMVMILPKNKLYSASKSSTDLH